MLLACWSSKVFCLWSSSLMSSLNILKTMESQHLSLYIEQNIRHFIFLDTILPSKSIILFTIILHTAPFLFPSLFFLPTPALLSQSEITESWGWWQASAPGNKQSRNSGPIKMLLLSPAALAPAGTWKKSSSEEASQRLLFHASVEISEYTPKLCAREYYLRPGTETSIVQGHEGWKLKWLTENLIKVGCIIQFIVGNKIKLIQTA